MTTTATNLKQRLREEYYDWRWRHTRDNRERRQYFSRLMETHPSDSRCSRYWRDWAFEIVPRWLHHPRSQSTNGKWNWGILQEAIDQGFGKDLVPALSASMCDPNEDMRCRLRAATALGKLGNTARSEIYSLISMLADKDEMLRGAAQWSLERILEHQADFQSALISALSHADKIVRRAAAKVFPRYGTPEPETVEALIQALGDEDQCVVEYAAYALGNFGAAAKPAIPILRRVLRYRVGGYLEGSCVSAAIRNIMRAASQCE